MTELLTDEQIGLRRQKQKEPRLLDDAAVGINTTDFRQGKPSITSAIAEGIHAIADPQQPQQSKQPKRPQRIVDRYGIAPFLEIGSGVAGRALGIPGGPSTMIAGWALGEA